MIIDAETYAENRDEIERPRAPRNYLDRPLVGRVEWISPDRRSIQVHFWEKDNPGVTDGHPDGFLGDIYAQEGFNHPELFPVTIKVGDLIPGLKVSRGMTMIRMGQELEYSLVMMTPADRDRWCSHTCITGERREQWELMVRGKRIRWAMNLESGDIN